MLAAGVQVRRAIRVEVRARLLIVIAGEGRSGRVLR